MLAHRCYAELGLRHLAGLGQLAAADQCQYLIERRQIFQHLLAQGFLCRGRQGRQGARIFGVRGGCCGQREKQQKTGKLHGRLLPEIR